MRVIQHVFVRDRTASAIRPALVTEASRSALSVGIAGRVTATRNAFEEKRNATTSCPVDARTDA
jgi:hypothetical protein